MAGRERTLSFVLYQEGDGFVARCLDVNVASEGDTEAEAVSQLREALELYFEDARAGRPTRTVIVPMGRKNLAALPPPADRARALVTVGSAYQLLQPA